MITVTANIRKLRMSIKGHDPVDEKTGQSLVCCAVSTLFYAMLYNIQKRNDEKENLFDMKVKAEKGDAFVEIDPEGYARLGYASLFEHFINGFRMLEEEHPESVKVIVE